VETREFCGTVLAPNRVFPHPARDFAKGQFQWSLKILDCWEHISALESVLFHLDGRARKLFEEQLPREHAKYQKEREALQMMLESLRATTPKMPS
jgi:hypothetical protein